MLGRGRTLIVTTIFVLIFRGKNAAARTLVPAGHRAKATDAAEGLRCFAVDGTRHPLLAACGVLAAAMPTIENPSGLDNNDCVGQHPEPSVAATATRNLTAARLKARGILTPLFSVPTVFDGYSAVVTDCGVAYLTHPRGGIPICDTSVGVSMTTRLRVQ